MKISILHNSCIYIKQTKSVFIFFLLVWHKNIVLVFTENYCINTRESHNQNDCNINNLFCFENRCRK